MNQTVRTYGPGGFKPEQADNNVLEETTVEVPDVISTEDRLANLEAEVRGMKERAAAAQVNGDAAVIRDAVSGK